VVVAHRHIESLSLLSVRGFLSSFEALVGERKLTTKGTTVVGIVTYENLMDATTVREQVQSVVSGRRGLFKTVTPLIVLSDDTLQPLPVALANLMGEHVQDTELMMASSVLTILPVLLVFLALQRYYIQGLMLGGVKE